jgi:glycosyltransferase involved in cell wall biosynthesis
VSRVTNTIRSRSPSLPLLAARGKSAGTVRDWVVSHTTAERGPGSVLMHAPSFAFQAPGGGENQLVQTARHLEEIGVGVRLFSSWTDRIEDYRLLHLFGMSREGLELARVARRRGVPVVLSPICWLEPRALFALAGTRARGIWHRAKWSIKGAFPRIGGWRDDLLREAEAILPNSTAEADQLCRLFRVPSEAIRVVSNGVDGRFGEADPSLFRAYHGHDDFILYAGRIEPRKNVLGLIHAARRAGRPLVLIGDAPPGHDEYLDECREAGKGLACWLAGVEHDDPLLASAYAAARVFALPSWFETPGLAALEAALAGTAVVITPLGCTREYFGDLVEYARPDRISEIASALGRAWDNGPRPGLAERVGSQFLWTNVARRTAEAYDQVAR